MVFIYTANGLPCAMDKLYPLHPLLLYKRSIFLSSSLIVDFILPPPQKLNNVVKNSALFSF